MEISKQIVLSNGVLAKRSTDYYKPIYIDQNNKKYKFVFEWCSVEKNFLPRMWILEYLQICSILDAKLMNSFKKENMFMKKEVFL